MIYRFFPVLARSSRPLEQRPVKTIFMTIFMTDLRRVHRRSPVATNWNQALHLGLVLSLVATLAGTAKAEDLLTDHPRPSYEDVEDSDAMAEDLRKSLANKDTYSFSRGWWAWDRLR